MIATQTFEAGYGSALLLQNLNAEKLEGYFQELSGGFE